MDVELTLDTGVFITAIIGLFATVLAYFLGVRKFRFETAHVERLEVIKKIYLAVEDTRHKIEAYWHRGDNDSLQAFRDACSTAQSLQSKNKVFLRASEFEKLQTFTHKARMTVEGARIVNENPEALHLIAPSESAIEHLRNALKPEGVLSVSQNEIESEFRQAL